MVVEAVLVVVISALLFQRSYKPVSRKGEDLTDKVSHVSYPAAESLVPFCLLPRASAHRILPSQRLMTSAGPLACAQSEELCKI